MNRQGTPLSKAWHYSLRGALLAAFLLAVWPADAADDEAVAFKAAYQAFRDFLNTPLAERAERELGEFVRKYTNSAHLPEAVLLQARAAFSLKKVPAALELLQNGLDQAGPWADQYRFWLGKMRLESADYLGAAAEFSRLLKDYPASTRRLEASYHEALAHFMRQEWAVAVDLLRTPDGSFQKAAQTNGDPELVARGQLLLAETLFRQHEFAAAELAVGRVATNIVDVAWGRLFLFCRLQLETSREANALAETTNLCVLAASSGQAALQAQSWALQGSILERLQRYEAASAAYEKVQDAKMPAAWQREAALKCIELQLTLNNLGAASARLDRFLAARPEDAATDRVLLTLGELRLKEHLAGPGATSAPATNPAVGLGTNRLLQALACFDQLLQKQPQSPLLGRAYLDSGWALLAAGKTLESQGAFTKAVEKLPLSEDQAVARFKLADIQFAQNDCTNALAGYRKVIEDYGGLPRVRTGLFDRAWYQMARVCMKIGDLPGANDALRRILAVFPASLYGDRSLLLYGQELNQTNRPAEARAVFSEYIQRFTNSTLLPQAQMGLARAYELEKNWAAALRVYDQLLARFPTNAVAPRAEYNRALAFDQAGQNTNAFTLLTNFLARYPNHEKAPSAQDWLGDFYFHNEDFAEAERYYQRLYQNTNWPPGDITFMAWLKAGRAAFRRQGFDSAVYYFTNLINDKQCPADLVAEALFAYGDTLLSRPPVSEATNSLARFEMALEVFHKIPQLYPASRLVPRALGQMASCHFQLAKQDPRRYTNAVDLFAKATAAPQADIAARSEAEFGLGKALARQAELKSPADPDLLKAALDHYLNVVLGANLRSQESPVPLWVKETGFAAAEILEQQKRWAEAIRVYQRLQQVLPALPALKVTLERKIAAAREQGGGGTE
jgi:TolA-binding protein